MPIWKFLLNKEGYLFVDGIALDDSLELARTCILDFSDSMGINDALEMPVIKGLNLEDSIGINDSLFFYDFVLKWRARTKIPKIGYGNFKFGYIGYGSGEAGDLAYYILRIYKTSTGVLLREVLFNSLDLDNPDITYVYSYDLNKKDNGSYSTDLTFRVFQVDSEGQISLMNQIIYA